MTESWNSWFSEKLRAWKKIRREKHLEYTDEEFAKLVGVKSRSIVTKWKRSIRPHGKTEEQIYIEFEKEQIDTYPYRTPVNQLRDEYKTLGEDQKEKSVQYDYAESLLNMLLENKDIQENLCDQSSWFNRYEIVVNSSKKQCKFLGFDHTSLDNQESYERSKDDKFFTYANALFEEDQNLLTAVDERFYSFVKHLNGQIEHLISSELALFKYQYQQEADKIQQSVESGEFFTLGEEEIAEKFPLLHDRIVVTKGKK